MNLVNIFKNKKNKSFVSKGAIFLVLFVVLTGVFTPSVTYGQAPSVEALAGLGLSTLGKDACIAGGGTYNEASKSCSPSAQQVKDATKKLSSTSAVKDAAAWAAQVAADAALSAQVSGGSYLLMTLSSMILIFSGWIFDGIINYTIVDVAKNIGPGSNMGNSISVAWATLRDIANMSFIFVLLYAAFKAMFDTNFGNANNTIKNVIIVALLINFSLFFTKVVIDASNVVSLGFYKSIASNNMELGSGIIGGTANYKGISGGYMRMMGLQTWYSANVLQNGIHVQHIFLTGVLSSAFMLIASIIFLMTGIMFATRFIILIFLMILSPLALVAITIPGMKNHFETWKDAVISQSFFAPLFFALTWVSFKLANTLVKPSVSWADIIKDPTVGGGKGATELLLNFVLVIGFSIAALVFAKQIASKTPFFGKISGGIGAGAIGIPAWALRNSVGRKALAVMNDKDLRDRAARGDIRARMKLNAAYKLSGSSFDIRGLGDTEIGKAVGAGEALGIAGKAGGKGGFAKTVEEKAKKEAEYAKKVYGQTEEEKEEIERLKREEKNMVLERRDRNLAEAETELAEAEKNRKKFIEDRTEEEKEAYEETKREKRNKETALSSATSDEEKEKLRKDLAEITTRMANNRALLDEKRKEIEENNEEYQKLKIVAINKKDLRDEAKRKKNQKDIDKEEYSKELQKRIGAGDERIENYAKRLENGPSIGAGIGFMVGGIPGVPIGFLTGDKIGKFIGEMQGNKAAAREVRKLLKKDDKKKATEALKALMGEQNESKKTEEPINATGNNAI